MPGIQYQFLPVILIVLMAISGWISINLLFNQTGDRLHNRLLGGFVFIQLLPLANVYSKIIYGTNEWTWLLASNLTWLYGPFLFCFIQILLKKNISRAQFGIHFLPFFAVLFYRLSPFSFDFIPWYIIFALFAQVSLYVVYALSLLFQNKNNIVANIKAYKTAQFYWLGYLIIGLFLLIFMDVYFHVKSYWFEPMDEADWFTLIVFISLYLHGIAFCSIYRPNVFYHHYAEFIVASHKTSSNSLHAKQVDNNEETEKHFLHKNRDYKELDEILAQTLSDDLASIMETKKPYLLNDLTLQNLAEMLSLNKHQLSELLNVHLSKSFYDYINQFRISYAMALLKSDDSKQGILAIAFESGFNNKNSFYRLFKERTGLTPSEYRRSMNNECF